jgi:hypothetical protein
MFATLSINHISIPLFKLIQPTMSDNETTSLAELSGDAQSSVAHSGAHAPVRIARIGVDGNYYTTSEAWEVYEGTQYADLERPQFPEDFDPNNPHPFLTECGSIMQYSQMPASNTGEPPLVRYEWERPDGIRGGVRQFEEWPLGSDAGQASVRTCRLHVTREGLGIEEVGPSYIRVVNAAPSEAGNTCEGGNPCEDFKLVWFDHIPTVLDPSHIPYIFKSQGVTEFTESNRSIPTPILSDSETFTPDGVRVSTSYWVRRDPWASPTDQTLAKVAIGGGYAGSKFNIKSAMYELPADFNNIVVTDEYVTTTGFQKSAG